MVVICEFKLYTIMIFKSKPYQFVQYGQLGSGINQFGFYNEDFLIDIAKNKITL